MPIFCCEMTKQRILLLLRCDKRPPPRPTITPRGVSPTNHKGALEDGRETKIVWGWSLEHPSHEFQEEAREQNIDGPIIQDGDCWIFLPFFISYENRLFVCRGAPPVLSANQGSPFTDRLPPGECSPDRSRTPPPPFSLYPLPPLAATGSLFFF